jgi:hypothetical protein
MCPLAGDRPIFIVATTAQPAWGPGRGVSPQSKKCSAKRPARRRSFIQISSPVPPAFRFVSPDLAVRFLFNLSLIYNNPRHNSGKSTIPVPTDSYQFLPVYTGLYRSILIPNEAGSMQNATAADTGTARHGHGHGPARDRISLFTMSKSTAPKSRDTCKVFSSRRASRKGEYCLFWGQVL